MNTPVSDFLRPRTFEEVVGQEKIVDWVQKIIKTKNLYLYYFGDLRALENKLLLNYMLPLSMHPSKHLVHFSVRLMI